MMDVARCLGPTFKTRVGGFLLDRAGPVQMKLDGPETRDAARRVGGIEAQGFGAAVTTTESGVDGSATRTLAVAPAFGSRR